MNRKISTGVNVGGSSILVIFILLCLTTFATLSMVSANADLRLTEKSAAAVNQYYAADFLAEHKLGEIDGHLQIEQAKGLPANEYLDACKQSLSALDGVEVEQVDLGTLSVKYDVPVSENQKLAVTLTVQDFGSQQRYIRQQWVVVSTTEWEPESDGLDLWSEDEELTGLAVELPIV